jgi:hypothetical protein
MIFNIVSWIEIPPYQQVKALVLEISIQTWV